MQLSDVLQGAGPRLDDLIDRESLGEVLRSFCEVFAVPVRVFTADGPMLADALPSGVRGVNPYLESLEGGREAVADSVRSIRAMRTPTDDPSFVTAFDGARYAMVPLVLDHRVAGRVIAGPYRSGVLDEPPETLFEKFPQADRAQAKAAYLQMSPLDDDRARAMAQHLRHVFEVLLFNGHRALLMSQMHVAATRESYRELQEKHEALVLTVERLRELDRLKSNFLATVSHELRTPLTSIIGYSDMLAEGMGGTLTPDQLDFVRIIRDRGDQLLGLITSLLDLSKLERGALTFTPGALSMGELATEVVATLLPSARKKSVWLSVDASRGTPEARGDRDRLRQVLLNIVENALKFTPSGGSVQVTVRPVPATGGADDEGDGVAILGGFDEDVEVRVTDTGIGLPEEEREKVFDAFYQVDSSSTRHFGGAGLGLSIVKKIVETHGGRVRAEGNPAGQGTVFVVTLPAVRA